MIPKQPLKTLLFFSTLFLLLAACGSKGSSEAVAPTTPAAPPVAKIEIAHDTLLDIHLASDSFQSYYIYSPSGAAKPETSPVIVFFDPHGAGSLPVEKYRNLADQFGVVLAGSNNTMNGQSPQESAVYANNLINDLTTRIGYDSRNICLAGFSGGAKVALNSGINNNKINNIIYSGASTPFNPDHPVHLLGFAGTEDMNYSDLLGFAAILDRTNPGTNQLIEFKGKHEWPDTATYRKAFYWLRFQAYKEHSIPADQAVIDAFKKETDRRLANLDKPATLLNACQEYQIAVAFLTGLSDVTAYQARLKAIAADPSYTAQLKQKNDLIQSETTQKQMLLAAFQKEDGNWWYNTIKHYRESGAASDKRLLGFISLASFSYSGQLLTKRDTSNAAYILAIYEMADPDNTDQIYFYAILSMQQNKADQAMKYLNKAVEKGFKDWQKAEREPAFTPLRGSESFSRLVTSLKKNSR